MNGFLHVHAYFWQSAVHLGRRRCGRRRWRATYPPPPTHMPTRGTAKDGQKKNGLVFRCSAAAEAAAAKAAVWWWWNGGQRSLSVLEAGRANGASWLVLLLWENGRQCFLVALPRGKAAFEKGVFLPGLGSSMEQRR
jgi:hypothetical protein